jgi:lysophospholipase L1-like esterase
MQGDQRDLEDQQGQENQAVKAGFPLPLYLVGSAWLISLGFMIWAADVPSSGDVFYLAVGAFIGCSGAWVGLQLTQAGRAPGWFVVSGGGGFLLFGSVVLVCSRFPSLDLDDSAWLVSAGICLYMGLGFLIGWARVQVYGRSRWPFWVGLACLAGATGVIVGVGIALLKGAVSGGVAPLALGVSALLLLPIGINLLSEQALAMLDPRSGPDGQVDADAGAARPWLRRRSVWAAAGFILAAASGIALYLTSHSGWTVAVVGACLLGLMVALVSNTHADVAAALCLIALLGVAPLEVASAVAQPVTQPSTMDLLALGDSYMSGEGAATYLEGTDESGGDTCRRAPTAYAVLAVGPGQPFNHVTFLACSGARTNNVLSASAPAVDEPPNNPQAGEKWTQVDQIDQLKSHDPSTYRPRLAIVALGGNDAGFADLGEACVAPGDCTEEQDMFLGNLARVKDQLLAAYAAIKAALPPGTPVLAVPYPQPLANTTSCGAIALTLDERNFIRTYLATLDRVIEWVAAQEGFYYLGQMENALAEEHLQLCDPKNQGGYGINFVSPESVNGLPDERFNPVNWLHDSFHPNERGHQAMLDVFNQWLAGNDMTAGSASGPTSEPENKNQVAFPALPPAPRCLFGAATNSCDAELRAWEYQNILDLWPYAIAALAGLVGLWMLSVAGLSFCPYPERPKERPAD